MVLKIYTNFSLLSNPSNESSLISKERFDTYGKIHLISYSLFFSVILFFSICMLYIWEIK